MQRYFVEGSSWENEHLWITGEDVHHISRVMRMDKGDKLIGIHPELGPAICKILEVTSNHVECCVEEWLEENRELPVQVSIVQSLGKGDKLEQVVQKGTELGAYSFIPYQAERSVAKWDDKKTAKKIQRLQKIAKEASEQSERIRIPEIHSLLSFQELIHLTNEYDWCILAHAEEARRKSFRPLASMLEMIKPHHRVLVIFGPEGGFSEKEVSELVNAGFLTVRLGPRILRMETAPLYFLSTLSYHFEELRK
ncbi:16S rRNA (uracil1498-N3)-methyltransferase [Halobacillus alkaliphilus]|uniref:Ribosomal RNA small subunit methyltransferase E n=1 Tax=Halobacillus alkaliphilus TaxID=396056 RepID=A0A1I2JFU6_9BACI|nr:16S rRNA (uracil(1498)-N(3))-methyltransferase [Halobacillus alkaliphilus]SFF53434.1 16S rRNA (uracil1498-N3)-methyltransferase [Halobacillus alkaliphilus]